MKRDIIALLEDKFDEICDRDNLNWWELFDSPRFAEVEQFAEQLKLTKREKKLYENWCYDMGNEL